ncbi:hypothetical protein Tco_0134597 [Tanacetum coccineum]
MAMSNDPLSLEIGSCDRPKCQEAMGGVIAQTRYERASKHSYDSTLLGVNIPGSDEERLEQHELIDNVPSTPHDSPLLGEGLESHLKKTKKLYATAFKKLINRVMSFEDELKFQKSKSKRRRLTLVTFEDEGDLVTEDPSKPGRILIEEMDLDARISLVSPHVEVQGSPQRNADTTADDLTLAETLIEIIKSAAKDKTETQRMDQVHQAAQGFTETEWDDVLARVAVDEDFVHWFQAGSGEEQSAEKEKELSEEELQKLLVIVPVEELVIQPLQIFNRDNLVKLWDLVKERFSITEPIDDKEKELCVELKRFFKPDKDDILWKLQMYMHDPLVWRLYDTCGVYHVSLVRGHDIFMLVEKEYPLTRGTLGLMMVARLLVEADSEMSRELLRKIFYQANRPRHWMVILSDFQEPDVRNGHEAYGVNIHLKTQVDGGRGQRRGRGGRGEWSGGSGESNAAMGEGSDGMGQRAGGRAQRGGVRYTLEVEARYEREDEERLREQIKEEEWDRKHNYFHPSNWTHKESSVVANLSDMGEIGFRLGDFEAEDNHMSIADGNADLGITCAQPIASVSPSVDKGKQVAEPSEEASPKPQAKKKGSKRKASSASEELPLRIIYHKNRGRSRRVNTK